MKHKIRNWILVAAAGSLLAGCITHRSTTYQDVERTPVQFESDAAARMFYETLSKKSGSQQHTERTTTVEIPFVFEHESKVVPGRNIEFNEAVAVCDSNHDGMITEKEARIYANVK